MYIVAWKLRFLVLEEYRLQL